MLPDFSLVSSMESAVKILAEGFLLDIMKIESFVVQSGFSYFVMSPCDGA